MCGCSKPKNKPEVGRDAEMMRSRGVNESTIRESVSSNDDFMDAVYNGPKYLHQMRSVTGVISNYGILHYGVGKRGDKIRVHKVDFEYSKGKLYLPISEGDLMSNKGIRGVEPVFTNNFSAEAETNKKIKVDQDAEVTADLVALTKEEGKAKDEQAVETKQAVPTVPQLNQPSTDANKDSVPDEQQNVTSSVRAVTHKKPKE